MNNMITYAETMLDDFEVRPFNSVDSLILAWVSYMQFPESMTGIRTWNGIGIRELLRAECFPEMFADLWNPEGSRELLFALAASPRFRGITVCGYAEQLDREREKQFSAVTFKIRPGLSYAAFRGTDATIVGWKEDFNMAFQCPVPSQEAAAKYLNEAAAHTQGALLIGGHSKGGNLSVYAAAKCAPEIQGRIQKVYSHDGPGFQECVLESPEFQRTLPKVEKTIPQSSLVGMLLENQEDFLVVKSSSVSLWQHDPFSWVVEDGQFCMLGDLTPGAKQRDAALNEWIRQLSQEERERFVDALFEVISVNGIDTVSEFGSNWKTTIPAAFEKLSQLNAETQEIVFSALKKLAVLGARNNFTEMLKAARLQSAEMKRPGLQNSEGKLPGKQNAGADLPGKQNAETDLPGGQKPETRQPRIPGVEIRLPWLTTKEMKQPQNQDTEM